MKEWLKLLKVHMKESPDTCIAVHCVAGLGRWRLFVLASICALHLRRQLLLILLLQNLNSSLYIFCL